MDKTKIEWTATTNPDGTVTPGSTWNIIRGCSRVSPGCGIKDAGGCYAERQALRQAGPGGGYEGLVRMTPNGPRWTGKISFHEKILLRPLRWKRPRKIFVNSMSDLFHKNVKDEWIDKAFAVMALTPQHTYQILTKRPERMLEYFDDPETRYRIGSAVGDLIPRFAANESLREKAEALISAFFGSETDEDGDEVYVKNALPLPNVWLGVSVEDQKTADERIPLLLKTPAAIRFLSIEPLLGRVEFSVVSGRADAVSQLGRRALAGIDWVIVGGESGPKSRACELGWILSIVKQCQATGVPVFVKQLGARPIAADGLTWNGLLDPPEPGQEFRTQHSKGGDMDEWPVELRVREFPRAEARSE